ncbi:ABC transporter substrate-binding protein [Nocardioides sp. LHD-245]|uniref:ABC transporter substrate-binding protein n=1 Tax=Nocardioides sp. LHD-245 TaxID=3051387 RepID=UPI0027E1B161|nr:ABC transporter substrate-binding protein [Nocardioides sp. LHD-245]
MTATPRPGHRRLTTICAALFVASLAFAGCASGSNDDSDGESNTELRIAVTAYPSSWDQDFVAFDLVALELYKNIYPYLVDYGTKSVDGGEILDVETIVPTYAESFDSPDGQNWTLKIKDDATFPNGDPITAEDVKWSKDRAFAANANVAGVYQLIGLTEPDQVEVVDEKTVVFHQSVPSALSAQIQAISLFVYNSKELQKHATGDDPWAQDWTAKNPSDGGYFTVESATPGQEIVLKKNPDYLGDNAPIVDEVHITVASNTAAAAAMLEAGDIDIAEGLSSSEIDDLEGADGVKIVSAPSSEMVYLPLNTASGPFADPTLRQAFAYALPYDQIIDTVYGGEGRRPKSFVPIDMPGYSETGFPYEQDVDKAKQLVAQSGESNVAFDLAFPAEDSAAKQIAVIIQDALADVGITVTPLPLDPAAMGEHREAKDLDAQVARGQDWVSDVEYLANNQLVTGGYLNNSNYSNATVDALVKEASTITDKAQREELWLQLQGELAKDVPIIPLVQPNYELAVRENVSGVVVPGDGLLRYNTISLD